MASNFFARMYSIARAPRYRVPLPAAQFLIFGRPSAGSSEERSFHPDNLHFARDVPESVARVSNKSAAFRQLIGAPPKSAKVSVTNMDAFGAKLKHRLGHGYANRKAFDKVSLAANNAKRNADPVVAAAAVDLNQERESEGARNDCVILPESRYNFSGVVGLFGNLPPTVAQLRNMISALRGESSKSVSQEDIAKLKRMFKFDGSPADMQAFVAAHRLAQAVEGTESQIIEAMNRNARMPKAANHVRPRSLFIIISLSFFRVIRAAFAPKSCAGKTRRQSMAPGQEENQGIRQPNRLLICRLVRHVAFLQFCWSYNFCLKL